MAARRCSKRSRRIKETAGETGATRAWEAEATLIRAKAGEILIQDREEEETGAAGAAVARTSQATWTLGRCGI